MKMFDDFLTIYVPGHRASRRRKRFTDFLTAEILHLCSIGITRRDPAEAARIATERVEHWLKEGIDVDEAANLGSKFSKWWKAQLSGRRQASAVVRWNKAAEAKAARARKPRAVKRTLVSIDAGALEAENRKRLRGKSSENDDD